MKVLWEFPVYLAAPLLFAALFKFFYLKYLKPRQRKYSILVLFGSQSGTAEDFAHDLARTLQKCFSNCVTELKCAGLVGDFQDRLGSFDFLFILTSTYGEGEPPLNAISFHDFLSSKQPFVFSKTRFAVFGLGDSSYTHFNAFAKFCDKRCHDLRGERFFPLTLGDDYEEGIREDYLGWKEKVLGKLSQTINGSGWKEKGSIRKYSICSFNSESPIKKEPQPRLGSQEFPLDCQVINLENLDNSCTYNEIKIFIPGCKASILPGDHVVVLPQNSHSSIAKVIEHLNLNEGDKFSLKDELMGELKFNGTWKSFLTSRCDLNKPISHENLKYLAQQTRNEKDLKFIKSLLTSFPVLVEGEYKNVVEVILCLKSVALEDFVNCVEFIYPRYYSIVDCNFDEDLGGIFCTLLFKNVNFSTAIGTCRNGLATGYFMTFPGKMEIFLSKSKFHMTKFVDRPVIMIANGTGIAPYVGFLQYRMGQQQLGKNKKFGEGILIYGCFNEEYFLYKEKFDYFVERGVLTRIIEAYSRDGTNQKEYVQDKLLQHQESLFELVYKRHAVVYVCGDSHGMGKAVRDNWVRIFRHQGSMGAEEAFAYLEKLIDEKRYLEDIY